MTANDPVCTITVPKNDEISLADVGKYGDRWYLGFIDAHDLESKDKVGEVMYEAREYNVFQLKPWVRITPESFSPSPNLEEYWTRFARQFPAEVNLLNPSEGALYQMNETQTEIISFGTTHMEITRPVLKIKAYSSWKGCAKARAEYFIRNRDFLGLDPSIDPDKFFMDNVHPTPIERDDDYNADTFSSKTYKGETVNPIETMGKMCEALEKSGEEWD